MDSNIWENHWKYCRLLELELEEIGVYIEPSKENFSCYSIKILRLINSAVSEFEVAAKELCYELLKSNKVKNYNISQIRDTIVEHYPGILDTEAKVYDIKHVFCPFKGWDIKARLEWWDTYNNLKHDRNKHFKRANLEMAYTSVAILKIILMMLLNYTYLCNPASTWIVIEVQEYWQRDY